MGRIRGFFNRIKRLDDRGETMILMIVACAIIMFLGASLLYATATALKIRINERQSEQTFNSADTGMDLLKNRLTEVESRAAESGYAAVLNLYSDSKYDQANFKNSFLDGLIHMDVYSDGKIQVNETADSGSYRLFTGTGSNITRYSPYAINYLFKGKPSAEGDSYKLTCNGSVKQESDGSAITLKGISLTYTRHDGYVTRVTTDIKLKVPQIRATTPGSGFEHQVLSGYSCVADQGIIFYNTQDSGGTSRASGSFSGSIYAGSVVTHEADLTVPEGHTITIGRTKKTNEDKAGNVYFSDDRTDGKLSVNPNLASGLTGGGIKLAKNSTLWTQDINLQRNAALTSDEGSSIRVADDLNFEDGGSAVIKGEYIGFGNGDTSDTSSSIIFNSKKPVNLDLSGVESLMLAGRSFVLQNSDDREANTEDEIGMGSSITAKSEQKAYLIPAGADGILGDKISNPQTVKSSEVETTKQKVIDLVNKNMGRKIYRMQEPLSAYDPTVKVLSYKISGTDKYKQYYFFSFGSISNANKYFKDYFAANSTEIDSYIRQYATISGLKGSLSRTAGTGLDTTGSTASVTDAEADTETMKSEAEKYQKKYMNLSETLDENQAGTQTPFYSMIDVKRLHDTCGSRSSKRAVPVAWWVDHNEINAVYGEDVQTSGSNNLVVTDRLYNSRGNYIMFTYQNAKLYKIVFKKSGDDIQTVPDSADRVAIETDDGIVVKSDADLTQSEKQSIVGVVDELTEATNSSILSKCAGYAYWGDLLDGDNTVDFPWGDEQINFLVVDGNVRIGHDFHGLIMCSGTLEVVGNFRSDNDAGVNALAKSHIWASKHRGGSTSAGEDWTLGKMVVYENWKKN